MNDILYTTTFNKKLFDATGQQMISSFFNSEIEGDLLIAYEDDIENELPLNDKTILFSLDRDEFLQNWLEKNKDFIPVEHGGTYPGNCNCEELIELSSESHRYGHLDKCLNMGFNRRSSLWFRKIAAMNHALKLSEEKGYSKVVFIDSDVVFKNKITEEFMNKVFGNNGFFFHLGTHRKRIGTGIESGFIGFSKDNRGFEFLQIVIDSFTSGDYRKYDRWDDGYVFRKVWEEHPEIPSRDVVGPHAMKPFSHVVRYGIFAKYLTHDKGIHTHKYQIFKDSTRL